MVSVYKEQHEGCIRCFKQCDQACISASNLLAASIEITKRQSRRKDVALSVAQELLQTQQA